MTAQARNLAFDRDKPFYPLVVSYVAQLVGARELMVRGHIGADRMRVADRQAEAALRPSLQPDEVSLLDANRGPLRLGSAYLGTTIDLDTNAIANELASIPEYHLRHATLAAASVLILAWELTDQYHPDRRTNGPLWEFLFHCRNAAAHGGKFRFTPSQPASPAVWGQFQITRQMEGTPLFRFNERPGLLSHGDPIRLLWDIEQAHPELRATL